jgi:predicted protein tyrosine phosphatase
MIIDVRSRKIIEQNRYDANIISITSQPICADIKNRGPTLYLHFEDFDTELPGWSIQPIQKEDAKKIATFVIANEHNGKNFIIQCDAGVSRSAGVAAALMEYFNGDASPIFDNLQYCPNMRCYRMVLEVLMEDNNG